MDKKIILLSILGLLILMGCQIEKLPEYKCAPAECCHPITCVIAEEKGDCQGTFCTADCRADTMDCSQGHCEYNYNLGKCEVIWGSDPLL